MRKIINCKRCGKQREYHAKGMCRSCYGVENTKNKKVYCSVCQRDNMPYGGKNICRNCLVTKSRLKYDTPTKRKIRAEKEMERRKSKGETLKEKERIRGWFRRQTKEWKDSSLKWQRENKAWLKEYRKNYRSKHPENIKTWEENKRTRKSNAGIISPQDWKDILNTYKNSCYYCGKTGINLEQEHRTPLSRGGKHVIENIVPACRECNARKYTKTEEEFLKSR